MYIHYNMFNMHNILLHYIYIYIYIHVECFTYIHMLHTTCYMIRRYVHTYVHAYMHACIPTLTYLLTYYLLTYLLELLTYYLHTSCGSIIIG